MTRVPSRQSTSYEWVVRWCVCNDVREQRFEDEDAAREWLRYVTTDWGPDATAALARRAIGPWESVAKIGPRQLAAIPLGADG